MKANRKMLLAVAALAPLVFVPIIFKGEISSVADAIGAVVVTYFIAVILGVFFALLLGSRKTEPAGMSNGTSGGPDFYLNPNTHDVGVFNDGESVRINNL